MRICLVVHGFPPVERTGVENYTLGLCRAFVRAGHRVEVFVPRREPRLSDLALRREDFSGFAVNWITDNHSPSSPREALLVPQLKGAFASFLDRERPEVVHFQHLIKLGTGLVEVARERGLPTVYTAHDYYPICHRYTLLRPDLSRCDVRGDAAACARCDLALSHLNALPDLGDYHAGVLPAQLDDAAWARLRGILADELEQNGVSRETFAGLEGQRRDLDRLRAAAYRQLDLVLAPSRHLMRELTRGGLDPERMRHQPYGFENSDLEALPAIRPDPAKPVRFAFLGGLSKHKGVHVMLDAFARLGGRAELVLWGDSSDRSYVGRVRERCGEVGAQFLGPYERPELPQLLGSVDAVVVPSIWVENYPLVIHEAFSAGRPVIASDLGAIPESVRDGIDGLLFAPGDAADLARVLARCIDEPGLLERLAAGITPVKTMDEEVALLVEHYRSLQSSGTSPRASEPPPQSLRPSLRRYEELSSLPARELFVQVLSGLDQLREAWAGELGSVDAVELLAVGLGQGSEAQDRLREARNEIAWLRNKKEEFEEGREELMTLFEDLDRLLNETRAGSKRQAEELETIGAAERQKEKELRDAHARMRELESIIGEKNQHIGNVEGQLRDAGRYIRHKDKEYRDLEEELRKAAEYVRRKEEELRVVSAHGQVREGELRTSLQASETRRAELDLGTRSTAEVALLALEAQARVLSRAMRPLLARLHGLLAPRAPFEPPADGAAFDELVRALGELRRGFEAVAHELEEARGELPWRRAEMQRAVDSFERLPLSSLLARTAPGKKISSWRDGPPATEEPR